MRIASIHIENFLGAHSVDVRADAPVTLFAGLNGAGKSSIRDAIAIALTGDLGRVILKKEAGQLVRAGSDAAVCEIIDADGDEYRVTITAAGKITDGRKGRDADPVLPYVLDAQRFARLDDTGRRAFLFGLMGVKAGPVEIAERLQAKGCEAGKIERVRPLLRSGFDAASKEAKAKATEEKTLWRAISGETYGSEKAKTWRAHVPPYDAGAAKEIATELQHCDVAIGQWQQQVGKLQAEEQRRAGLRAKLPALREHASKIARISAKLTGDEQSLAEWEADLAKTAAAAGVGPRVGLVHDLAKAVAFLLEFVDLDPPGEEEAAARSAIAAYEREHGKLGATTGDERARARLPSVQSSRDTTASAIANDRRDLEAAKRALAEAESIEAELAEVFDAAGLADARDQTEKLKSQRDELVKKADAMKSIKAQIDAADKRTADAAAHAAAVAAWDAIGDALSPDGIPAEILAEALGPINDRLSQTAADTGWAAVLIAPDMAITAAGREYRLLSESERWRADAMLAEAIAHLSGARLLVLDRVDVLDLQGRQDLLSWLHTLADLGEIDSAVLFATLRAAPTGLPATIDAHWIENGIVGQLKEAA